MSIPALVDGPFVHHHVLRSLALHHRQQGHTMAVRLLATDRAGDGAASAPTAVRRRTGSATLEDDGFVPLPRHLLVGLHALSADIALVREGHVTDVPLRASLDRALSRIDGLVDSIYDLAAASAPLAMSGRSRPARSTAGVGVPHGRS